jgi:hypothetical protein
MIEPYVRPRGERRVGRPLSAAADEQAGLFRGTQHDEIDMGGRLFGF